MSIQLLLLGGGLVFGLVLIGLAVGGGALSFSWLKQHWKKALGVVVTLLIVAGIVHFARSVDISFPKVVLGPPDWPLFTEYGAWCRRYWLPCLILWSMPMSVASWRHWGVIQIGLWGILGITLLAIVASWFTPSSTTKTSRGATPTPTAPVASYACPPFSAREVRTCVLLAGVWSQWIGAEDTTMQYCALYSDGRETVPHEYSGSRVRLRSDTYLTMEYKLLPKRMRCPTDHF